MMDDRKTIYDKPQATQLIINTVDQTLQVYGFQGLIATYSVSTAANGVGMLEGSGCTPLGRHIIAQKFGENMELGTVFVGRVPTGEIYSESLAAQYPDRDWILTRILWLAGLEQGINKGKNDQGVCDTYQRYIYIHGTPSCEPMGIPLSHGCIRMHDQDLVELFDMTQLATPVLII